MDLQAFIELVQQTPTLADDAKQKYIAAAADYTPETRQKMADFIHEQETKLTQMVTDYGHQKAVEQQTSTADHLAKIHAQEIAERAEEEKQLAAMEAEIAAL